MSGCQWLCLRKPPRRVFIDSQGSVNFNPPFSQHTCCSHSGWLDLRWIYTGNHGASKIHVMWTNAGGLSGVALIGAEPGRCRASQERLYFVRNMWEWLQKSCLHCFLLTVVCSAYSLNKVKLTHWTVQVSSFNSPELLFQLRSKTFVNHILSCCQSNRGLYKFTLADTWWHYQSYFSLQSEIWSWVSVNPVKWLSCRLELTVNFADNCSDRIFVSGASVAFYLVA